MISTIQGTMAPPTLALSREQRAELRAAVLPTLEGVYDFLLAHGMTNEEASRTFGWARHVLEGENH